MNYHDKEMRAVYALTLCELIAQNNNVLCLEADLSKASGTNPSVSAAYPQNFINVGVAEANMIGLAAGLARESKIPFCASFTCFASRRVYDQITISVAYANTNVKIIGTAPGITQGHNGGTHMDFLDMAIMRTMPNMHVYSPCDVYELRAVMNYMAVSCQPTYMQLIRPKMPVIFNDDFSFNPQKATKLQDGSDITIVSTGYTTHLAVKAVEQLKKDGIAADHLHYSSVKPFDEEALIASAKKTNAVITVENQNIIGGLGSAACETLSSHYPVKVKRLGIHDQFGEVATEEYLLNKHGFNVEHIASAVKAMTDQKNR